MSYCAIRGLSEEEFELIMIVEARLYPKVAREEHRLHKEANKQANKGK